jgi:hypothetical protein
MSLSVLSFTSARASASSMGQILPPVADDHPSALRRSPGHQHYCFDGVALGTLSLE